jgi:hypothetical protein
VTRAKDLPLEALSASDQIPNPFFCRCWDTNGHELSGSIQASQLDGVPTVMLPLVTRTHRRKRGGHHVAVKAPIRELAVKDIPGTAGFIAGSHLSTGLPPLEIPAKLSEIIGELLDHLRFPGVPQVHGCHHGVLVHIHSDPDH